MVSIFFFFQNLGFLSSLTYLFAWFIFFCSHMFSSHLQLSFLSFQLPNSSLACKIETSNQPHTGCFPIGFLQLYLYYCFHFFAARQFVRLDTLIFLFFVLFCYYLLYFSIDDRFLLFVSSFLLFSFLFLILFQMTAGMSRKSFRFSQKNNQFYVYIAKLCFRKCIL